MEKELLLEIGTEEIPSGYLQGGLNEFVRLAEKCFSENRIRVSGGFQAKGTPRRIVLVGMGIADAQEDMLEEIIGPPSTVSFDKDGRPTKAAMGFAKRNEVELSELEIARTPKGEYLFIRKRTVGRPTGEVLSDVLPGLIGSIPWPKVMRWGRESFSFVRPIHWILALLDGKIVPFSIAGIESGNISRGHRFMAPDDFEVSGVSHYQSAMRERFVIVDPTERKELVEKEIAETAAFIGGRVIVDEELIETVANLVEFPSGVCGSIDSQFLSLPEPVLITAMRKHQKYFAVCDDKGKLIPYFVAVNNTLVRDAAVVKKGYERVLRARLSDAEFFVRDDQKRPLLDRLEDLKGVLFQAGLGTSYQKVQRFTRLARYMAEDVCPEKIRQVELICSLCKCDLTTQIVSEFPELQGVMGRQYAMMEGYLPDICDAIMEHYMPGRAGDDLPKTELGAVVGLADRIDTIAGFFAMHMEPTGSADPFALRRHAIAVLRILKGMEWNLSLASAVNNALEVLSKQLSFDSSEVFINIMAFFKERFKYFMQREGYENDFIEAATASGFDFIPDVCSRLDALKGFAREASEFISLTRTCKRVSNILKKESLGVEVVPALFQADCERELWTDIEKAERKVSECIGSGDYREALFLMAGLREPIDRFFQEVEVLVKDNEPLRANRVGLLRRAEALFLSMADFSKFQS